MILSNGLRVCSTSRWLRAAEDLTGQAVFHQLNALSRSIVWLLIKLLLHQMLSTQVMDRQSHADSMEIQHEEEGWGYAFCQKAFFIRGPSVIFYFVLISNRAGLDHLLLSECLTGMRTLSCWACLAA